MTTRGLITEYADQIEELIDSGYVWCLRIEPGESLEGRALIIDTHGKVLEELRRRGHHDVRGGTDRVRDGEVDPNGKPLLPGEYLAIGIPPAG